MLECDVLIVGGGPAGSTCARALRNLWLDVTVMDRQRFPRDKVCAGWITPQVIDELELDLDDYRRGRTLQPITGFRTGVFRRHDLDVGRDGGDIATRYDHPVSYGIRRCEFDHYLLQRSGARLRLGEGVATITRDHDRWIVNGEVAAPMLVGAGGHCCPVADVLNPRRGRPSREPLVVAQEAEFSVSPDAGAGFGVDPEVPELYFCDDMKGYGWCFRKQSHVNIGLGRLDPVSLPKATAHFVRFLEERRRIPQGLSCRWKGHAYLVNEAPRRHVVADGVLLVGDAAGLAYAQSGEGIRPAIESGMMAAATIRDASGCYSRERLASYEGQLRARLSPASIAGRLSKLMPAALVPPLAEFLLVNPMFVRHIAIDRWFLHANQPALDAPAATYGPS
jgi:menaquinone-9 beta-reductase